MHEQPRSGAVAVADDEDRKSGSGFLTSERQEASSLTPDEQEKLLTNWQAAKDRCEINRQLTDWTIDFTARRKVGEIKFIYHDCSAVEVRALESKWQHIKLALRLAREGRR